MKAPPIRLWIGVMIFFVTFTNYLLRANMSISILEMAKPIKTNTTPPCLEVEAKSGNNTTTTAKPPEEETEKYDWSEKQQQRILTAYFYGYITTVMPGGILAEILGPYHVILWSSVVCTIFTGLTPLFAPLGPIATFANRYIIGFFGGVAYPAVNVLIAKWAPPKEKGKFMAAMMGNTLGSVTAFTLVALVTDDYGWPWGFYVVVIIMSLFCLAFAIVVRDSPEKHPWISEEEKSYIRECQEGAVSKTKKMPPYVKILTSFPFWVTVIAQFGNLWGLNLVLTYGPKFMKQTLGFNLKSSAGLASLPYLARLAASSVFGAVGDWMRKKEVMSVGKLRKFFTIFSHLIPAACMALIPVAGCSSEPVVALLVLNQAFNGAVVVSHLVTPQDMAPNFAGSVFGMMNLVGMTTGIFVPEISGVLTEHFDSGLRASTTIYILGASVFAACGLIFIFFSSATLQPWNEIKEDEGETAK